MDISDMEYDQAYVGRRHLQGASMIPFILKGAVKIPSDPGMDLENTYDRERQIWVDRKSGIPAVVCGHPCEASRFGETPMSETREGTDQTEAASIDASRFGETSLSRTREGADQSEVTTVSASRFGETSLTKTMEGIDQGETSLTASRFGETTITAAREGIDTVVDPTGAYPGFDAPYSHF
jgi:hypothetical protein